MTRPDTSAPKVSTKRSAVRRLARTVLLTGYVGTAAGALGCVASMPGPTPPPTTPAASHGAAQQLAPPRSEYVGQPPTTIGPEESRAETSIRRVNHGEPGETLASGVPANFVGDIRHGSAHGHGGGFCPDGPCPDVGWLTNGCPPGAVSSTQPVWPFYNRFGVDPQEFLCNGGDQPPAARLLRNDNIAGLGPEDTVVHYTTEAGDIEFQASNRACLYAPRFASVRKMTAAVIGQSAVGAVGVDGPLGPEGVRWNQQRSMIADSLALGHSEAARRLDSMRERNRGVPVEGVHQLEQATDVLAALAGLTVLEIDRLDGSELAVVRRAALAAITWSTELSVEAAYDAIRPPVITRNQSVEGVTVYDFPDAGRLRIGKLADRDQAQPGDTVGFLIRVDNVGDSPVDQVVIADNLTTRLAYVDGSQSCDVEADFRAEPNDVGSSKLTWTLRDPLAVGDSVIIRFDCLVR